MSSTTRDPYEVLGVGRDADDKAIKKAFRRLARELHPDVNAHDPQAEEKFKEAAEAYEILSDPERRSTYDRYGHDGLRSGGMGPNFEGFGSISDLFDAFFGGGGRGPSGPAQGGDVAIQTEVTLADAARGTQVELSFEAVERCETCNGNGAEPGTPIETCERCGGQGRLQAALNERDVLVRIGAENDVPALQGLTMVAAGYGLPARKLGAVSVIGPRSLDYPGVIRSVRDAATQLSRFIEDVYDL